MIDLVTIINGEFDQMVEETSKLFRMEKNLIISLDYYSHKQLERMNIKHEIGDNYLNDVDKKTINQRAFDIATGWYKNKKIDDTLTIDGINFGWLLVQEFYTTLIPIMLNFLILLKIKEKEDPKAIVISNDLFNMAETVFTDCEIKKIPEKIISERFAFDKLPVKYNIGRIPLAIMVPRKYFFMLRKCYEKSILPLFNRFFTNLNKRSDSVLLVDFNPIQYEEFLKELQKQKRNVLLLNRRRIALWNVRAFNIVKKTKCIPISYEQFLDHNDKIEIQKKISDINKKIDSILSTTKLFEEIFSVQGYSFWDDIRRYFKNYCIERFEEAIYEMAGSRKLLLYLKPKLVIHFYQVALQEKVLVYNARQQGIPTIVLQHGTPYLSFPNFPLLNPVHGTLPLYEDKKMAFWGNMMKEYALKNGMKDENIIVSGSLRHDPFFREKKIAPDNNGKGNILIALLPLDARNVDNQTVTTYIRYEECLKVICNTVKKIRDRKKIVKLHPGDRSWKTLDVKPIISSIDSSIQIVLDADLIELLQSSDIVISVGLTTVLMEANILEKPTLTLIADNQDFLSTLSSGHTVLFTPEEADKFEMYLNDVLGNKEICDDNIRKGCEFVNSYLANHGTASEYLAKIIAEY